MRRRFLVWAAVLFGPLAFCSCVGQAVLEAVGPLPDDQVMFAPVAANRAVAARDVPRYDLLSRGPTAFDKPRKPNASETGEFDQLMTNLAGNPNGFGRNDWTYQTSVDGRRAAEEWGPLGALARRPADEKPNEGWLTDEGNAVWQAVRDMGDAGPAGSARRPFGFRTAKAVSIARASVGTEVRIVARHAATVNGVETVWYTRWFLTRKLPQNGSGWAVYDFDEPAGRTRLTARRAGDATARLKADLGPAVGTPPMEGYGDAVRDGLAAAAAGDAVILRGMAAKLAQADLIPALTAGRLTLDGHIALADGKPADALKQFDAALAAWKDTPPARIGRAAALNRLKRYDEALKAVAAYRAEVGNGPEAFIEEARAKRGQGDATAAAQAVKDGLAETPGELGLLAELAATVPAEAGEKAAESGTPGRTLAALMARLEAADGGLPADRAAAVAKGFRDVRPRDPAGFFEDGLAKLRQGKPADALKRFQDGRQRDGGADGLAAVLERAARLVPPADVYAAVGPADPPAVFAATAQALFARMTADPAARAALAGLVDRHRAAAPADPQTDLYAVELAVWRSDLPAADRLLADAARKIPAADADGPLANRLRDRRTAVLYRLGRWSEAYADLPPAAVRFRQLAEMMAAANDADGLLGLAAAHAKAVPADPEAAAVRADGHFRKKQYQAAAEAAQQYLTGTAPNAKRWATASEVRVRSLVRLGRAADARVAADEVRAAAGAEPTAARMDLAFLLQAVATDGPEGLLQQLADGGQSARWARRLYADPDLGPRLLSPEFEPFRDRFPPPVVK